jgi:hypothetical protein
MKLFLRVFFSFGTGRRCGATLKPQTKVTSQGPINGRQFPVIGGAMMSAFQPIEMQSAF